VEVPAESVLEHLNPSTHSGQAFELLNGRTLGRSGTRAALELLEPMEPYVSDNVLNGAQRLNGLNDLNAPASSLSLELLNGATWNHWNEANRWNVWNG